MPCALSVVPGAEPCPREQEVGADAPRRGLYGGATKVRRSGGVENSSCPEAPVLNGQDCEGLKVFVDLARDSLIPGVAGPGPPVRNAPTPQEP